MGDDAPNKADERVIAVLRHYISASKDARHKEMIEQVILEGTSAHLFLEKIEERRKGQESFRNMDLRGQVKGACRSYMYRNRLMWLDDRSYNMFRAGLEAHNGVFTVGTYEAIMGASHVSRPGAGTAAKKSPPRQRASGAKASPGSATAASPATAPNGSVQGAVFDDSAADPYDKFRHDCEPPEVIRLGYYRERREMRIEYVMSVQAWIDQVAYTFKTSNLSMNGLAIYTREIVPVQEGQTLQVDFNQFNEELGSDFTGIAYKVLRVSHESHGLQLHLMRLKPDADFEQDMGSIIRRLSEKHGEDLSDERMTAMALIAERLYTASTAVVPLFLSRDRAGQLRVEGIGQTERNGYILDLFVTQMGWTDLEGLVLPSRVARYIEIVDAGGQPEPMLAVYRDKDTKRMVVAADFEFAGKGEWLRFLNLAQHRTDFRALKLLIKPIRCPSCEKLTGFVDSVMSHSLAEAEDVVDTAHRTIGIAALVDITDEVLRMQQCRPLDFDAKVIPDGDMRPLDPYAIAHNPEIVRFGSLEQRRESRFKARLPVGLRVGDYQLDGRTQNLSTGGMCIEVSDLDASRIKRNALIHVSLTSLAKKAGRQDLTNIAYHVIRVERDAEGQYILCVQRLLEEGSPGIDEFLENLIEINRHKLDKDFAESVSVAKTRLFEAMTAGSTATVPMFIMRDEEDNLRLKKVAPPRQAGTLTDFFEVAPGEYDFSPLAVPKRIIAMYGKCSTERPCMVKLYLYKEQIGPAQFEILCASDDDFASARERQEFLAEALEHEHLFVAMLAVKAVTLSAMEIDKMIDPLRAKSPFRALQLRKEMTSIVAVADLIDLTREVAESVLCEAGK